MQVTKLSRLPRVFLIKPLFYFNFYFSSFIQFFSGSDGNRFETGGIGIYLVAEITKLFTSSQLHSSGPFILPFPTSRAHLHTKLTVFVIIELGSNICLNLCEPSIYKMVSINIYIKNVFQTFCWY